MSGNLTRVMGILSVDDQGFYQEEDNYLIRRLKVQISMCPFQRCQLNLPMQITGLCVPQKQVHCFKIPFILQINCTTGINCNATFIQITWWYGAAHCLIEKVFFVARSYLRRQQQDQRTHSPLNSFKAIGPKSTF